MSWLKIAEDNVARLATEPPRGDFELKRLAIPPEYRSGKFRVKAYFTSSFPGGIASFVRTNTGIENIWWTCYGGRHDFEFTAKGLEWVSCGRYGSGDVPGTSTLFEVYYESESAPPPGGVPIYFGVKDVSGKPIERAKITLGGATYYTDISGTVGPLEVPPNKDYSVKIDSQDLVQTTMTEDAFAGDTTIYVKSVLEFRVGDYIEIGQKVNHEVQAVGEDYLILRQPLTIKRPTGISVKCDREIHHGTKTITINSAEGDFFYVVLPTEIMISNIKQAETAPLSSTVNISMTVKSISKWFNKSYQMGAYNPITGDKHIPGQFFKLDPGQTKTLTGSFPFASDPHTIYYFASYVVGGGSYVIGAERTEDTTELLEEPPPPSNGVDGPPPPSNGIDTPPPPSNGIDGPPPGEGIWTRISTSLGVTEAQAKLIVIGGGAGGFLLLSRFRGGR